MQEENAAGSENRLRLYIAARRQELRLTQRELATLCELPLGTLSGIESGREVRAPRAHTVEKLAVGLQTTYEHLDALVRGVVVDGVSEVSPWEGDYRYRLFDALMQAPSVPETERLMLIAKMRTLWEMHGSGAIAD